MMPTKIPKILLEVDYYQAAQDYLRSLPLEHFMEATTQSIQRKITVESLDLVTARWPDFQVFSELLVQYPRPRQRRPGQVVPDNMVVVHNEPIEAEGSYDVPLQPVGPLWVLEYVSKSNRRKDYVDNMDKYERELKVPYYLLFEPDRDTMTLYRHTGKRFTAITPDANDRCAIKDLDIEIGRIDNWVRFWYKGELLPLPADLLRSLEEAQARLAEMSRRADAAAIRADEETRKREALEREVAELRAKLKNGKNGRNGKR
jgi:Uma2 family endonuclease